MKFSEHLRLHSTSEWRSQYISYDDMNELLNELIVKAPPINNMNQDLSHQQYFLHADKEFFEVKQLL